MDAANDDAAGTLERDDAAGTLERDDAAGTLERDDAAGTLERAVALGRLSGLAELDPALRTTLAARAELRRHAAGSRFGADPARREIHLVLEGLIVEAGREVAPGGLVGDLGSLAGAPACEAAAQVESVTLALALEDVIDLCEEHFGVLVGVFRAVARAALATEAGASRARAHGSASVAERGPEDLGLADRIELLAANPTLANVAVHTLGQLAQEARVVELEAGAKLWNEGDVSEQIVAVARGELIERTGAGREVHRAGDLAGLLESLAGVPRSGDAVAGTPVVALALDAALLFDAMEDDVETAVDVLAALGGALSGSR